MKNVSSDEIQNPIIKTTSGSYEMVESNEDSSRFNFEMNPYVAKPNQSITTISKDASDASVSARMYSAGMISTYKEKLNSQRHSNR